MTYMCPSVPQKMSLLQADGLFTNPFFEKKKQGTSPKW
jgi:hypothetical protein